jgi:hypothetical protein
VVDVVEVSSGSLVLEADVLADEAFAFVSAEDRFVSESVRLESRSDRLGAEAVVLA